jgi:AraC-like DNA-binding protein
MTPQAKYHCEIFDNQRMFIPNLCDFVRSDDSPMHIIKGTLLCFCRCGEAKITINYESYQLHTDEVLAILPTHLFTIETISADAVIEAVLYTDEFWASMSQSVDYRLLKIVEQNPFAILPKEGRDEALTLLELVRKHDEAVQSGSRNAAIERTVTGGLAFSLLMLLVMLIEHSRPEAPRPTTRREVLVHDFFELLAVHYTTERRVAFYASKLCVTPKYLTTMVKEVTGLSILEWINNVTVLNIKRLLRTSQATIQQISEELNFQTPSTFVRYFRQHTGTTPLKYRNGEHLAAD